jgi:hypothetical protein
MLQFLKVFGRGVLTTVLLPVILLVWVLYGVYCIGLFIFMFFKSTIEYFQGKTFNAELPEDLEARRIILEKEQQAEQAKDALSMMYQNMTQTIMPPKEGEPIPDNPFQENPEPFSADSYGPDNESVDLDDEYGEIDNDLRGD